jgi:inosine kinase
MLLGAIGNSIRPGTPAFSYVAKTPPAVNLDYCQGVKGATGVAVTFITPDGDRGFGVAPGVSGDYEAAKVPEEMVRRASMAVTSLYCIADPSRPIAAAAERMLEIARDADLPVVFGLGTARLVRELRDQVKALLAQYVTIAAMNQHEAEALTGESDVLLASEQLLDIVDVVLITEGPQGLTLAGWTDEDVKRETRHEIRSKSIPDYNRWEFSRVVRKKDCDNPLKIYSHIHPFRGGPEQMGNTNGAGDAALAALLHDVAANHYHRSMVPGSRKHSAERPFLTYSSLSRNAQYCNRVAYEVLRGRSPRLNGPVGRDDEHGTLDGE